MKANWWSCVLGLLCIPAEVILSTWTVSQDPLSISQVTVNSSTEITCSTSLSDPMGFYLQRGVHDNMDVVFLDLQDGKVTKNTIATEFLGRIHIDQLTRKGHGVTYGFTLQLSQLGLGDTDFYYCSWIYFKSETADQEKLSSSGTVIIVTERDPHEQCKNNIGDLIFIALSVTAFTSVLFLFIGTLIVRCKRFKKRFRPARAVHRCRHNRPQHVSHQQRDQYCPYMTTSASTLDFRGIL